MVLFRHNIPQPTQAELVRGEFHETLCIEQGAAFLQVCRVEGATFSSCAPGGSRESVKCQVKQEACVPSWNNQLYIFNSIQNRTSLFYIRICLLSSTVYVLLHLNPLC